MAGIFASLLPIPGVHHIVDLYIALNRGSLILLNQLSHDIHSIRWVIQLQGLSRKNQSLGHPEMVGRDLFLVKFKSFVVAKPGHSSVVTGYQVDEFTCTWSADFMMHNHTFTLSSQVRCQPLPT